MQHGSLKLFELTICLCRKLPTIGNPRGLGKSLHFRDLFLCGWMSLAEFSEGQWYRNPECFPRSRAKLLQIDMIEDENCRASQA